MIRDIYNELKQNVKNGTSLRQYNWKVSCNKRAGEDMIQFDLIKFRTLILKILLFIVCARMKSKQRTQNGLIEEEKK